MALFNTSNLMGPNDRIEPGDCGVILKSDGTFRIFTTGAFDKDNMTEAQIDMGEKIMAIGVALQIPAVMDVLKQLAGDPSIVGQDVLQVESLHVN